MIVCSMRLMPLLSLIIIFLCMPGKKMGHASDAPAGSPTTCGGYTYTLPEGFMDANLHMEFKEYLHIDKLFSAPIRPDSSFVGCITIEHASDDGFIAKRIKLFVRGADFLKNSIDEFPVPYEIEHTSFINFYFLQKPRDRKVKKDFTHYLIELKAEGNEDHALLYVRDLTCFEIPIGDLRTREQREPAENSSKKERAMQLIRSVHRARQ